MARDSIARIGSAAFGIALGLLAPRAMADDVGAHCSRHEGALEHALDQLALANLAYERLCVHADSVRAAIRFAQMRGSQCDCVQAGMAHAQALVTLHWTAGRPIGGDAAPICAWARDEWLPALEKRTTELRDSARLSQHLADVESLAPECRDETCPPAPLLQCWTLGLSDF